jgi:hypothetical protein
MKRYSFRRCIAGAYGFFTNIDITKVINHPGGIGKICLGWRSAFTGIRIDYLNPLAEIREMDSVGL